MVKKLREILGLKKTSGDVGIEVEMELNSPFDFFNYFECTNMSDSWDAKEDGSLKKNPLEIISQGPIKFDQVEPNLKLFWDYLSKNGYEIHKSVRAGVHVHLNVQELTLSELFNVLAVYYSMESILTRFCGETRSGNLFCLRAVDSGFIPYSLSQLANTGNVMKVYTDDLRYSALNLQSLFKFGSIEFRALGTEPHYQNIVDWVKIIKAIKDYALSEITHPTDVLMKFSGDGPREFIRTVLGDELFKLVDCPELEDDSICDIREMQSVYYQVKDKYK